MFAPDLSWMLVVPIMAASLIVIGLVVFVLFRAVVVRWNMRHDDD